MKTLGAQSAGCTAPRAYQVAHGALVQRGPAHRDDKHNQHQRQHNQRKELNTQRSPARLPRAVGSQ
jgi:hypothetical protein